jgi:hypothetical protein
MTPHQVIKLHGVTLTPNFACALVCSAASWIAAEPSWYVSAPFALFLSYEGRLHARPKSTAVKMPEDWVVVR